MYGEEDLVLRQYWHLQSDYNDLTDPVVHPVLQAINGHITNRARSIEVHSKKLKRYIQRSNKNQYLGRIFVLP